ncbi:MAG: hypothetical protein LV479_13280 [Methylacidiphilales bacterium]|nr:hypothetical protein [Candidatus Methylacidiphilales bacterium]
MKILDSGQCDLEIVLSSKIDLFICASGYESRAVHFSKMALSSDVVRKVVLPFKESKILNRANGDQFFIDNGFTMLPEIGESDGVVAYKETFTLLTNIAALGNVKARLVIDYSCMTRAWYGAFINALFEFKSSLQQLEVFFCYSPAKFSRPSRPGPNHMMGPLNGFRALRAVALPVALVIGLGYEEIRAAGLREYVDPARTVLFYTDPPIDPEFLLAVQANNKSLLTSVPESDQIKHSLMDMDSTAALLHETTSDLAKSFRVVVAPLGVKPFSLLSMLLAARYQEFDVWRVSGCSLAHPSEREAEGTVLAYRLLFGI